MIVTAKNSFGVMVNPLLTDLYQLTMAHSYWCAARHNVQATFDLYFRKAPFGGSYVLFGGLDECLQFLCNFKLMESQVSYISEQIPNCDTGFLDWLRGVDCSTVKIYAQQQGTPVFPNVPLMRVSGPLALVQLLETPLLNLVGYASLVMTNANRFRLAAGASATLLEFGVRRAQGPNGALTASKYCYLGGFDATSNVAAGEAFGIPLQGTQAHAYVSSFASLDDVPTDLTFSAGKAAATKFLIKSAWVRDRALKIRDCVHDGPSTSDSELAAFITYGCVYPMKFAALVDTYSTLQSGVPNFMCVALALMEVGHTAIGVRLDSGDLSALAGQVRKLFSDIAKRYAHVYQHKEEDVMKYIRKFKILVSDDLTVSRIADMRRKSVEIDAYGIGTHIVTCLEQPALGCVYKLSSVDGTERIKFSENPSKSSIPGMKAAFRVQREADDDVFDVLTLADEQAPKKGIDFLALDWESKNYVTIKVAHVVSLLNCVWNGAITVDVQTGPDALTQARAYVDKQVAALPQMCRYLDSGTRRIPLLVSTKLFDSYQNLRQNCISRFIDTDG